jgi:hypothetical protein
MPYKGERPWLMTMAISLSNEILTFLRASPNTWTMKRVNDDHSKKLRDKISGIYQEKQAYRPKRKLRK